MVVVLVGLLAMMGYVYQVPALYGIAGLTGIARATALALIALGAALLCVRPEEGLMAAITADNPGGHLLRRLLAPVMVVPFAMGWVQLHGERRGWFEDGMGTGLLMLFFIVSFSALLLANVRRVNRWAAAQAETQAERERLLDTIAADGEQLRAGNERLRSMFDSAGASIAQVDLDRGRFVRVNGEFSRMTGYAESDLLKMSLVDVTHPDDRPLVEEGLARARSGAVRGGYFAERRYVRADGRIIEVELHGSVVRDASDRPIEGTIVVIDVTARKRAERDLAAAQVVAERARAAAEQASEAKDHFLSVLSHELRTPLTPVLTGVSLLEGEALSARGRTILEVIQRNVELEARLIDDLLDLTRIARGKVMLDRRPQDLCTVLDQAVEVCQADIHARDLRLSIDYGPRPYIVNADAARVQQVLWNLLKNAVKFTPPGGGIHVRLRPLGGEVVVEVADSGIGIEPSAIETIFDAFAQAERSITRQYGGLGLGLAISRTLVELHGGRIEARSPGRGRGATFAVRLPLLSHGEPRAVEAIRERAREPAVHRPLRILLVEDHGDTADLMSTMLHQAGHTVESAADVTTALDTVARREFDLLISDLGLPDRSGLDLMRELRARGRQLPGIALSGYGQDRDIQESRAAGFAAHLVKPAEPQALLQAIERVSG
jgi:two-component system CheB/CheR fusion protein